MEQVWKAGGEGSWGKDGGYQTSTTKNIEAGLPLPGLYKLTSLSFYGAWLLFNLLSRPMNCGNSAVSESPQYNKELQLKVRLDGLTSGVGKTDQENGHPCVFPGLFR